MRLLALSALLFIAACGFEPLGGETTLLPVTKAAPTSRTALASIENGLPYDGCSFPVTIDGTEYAPSASSKALVEAFASKAGVTRANVTYRLTVGRPPSSAAARRAHCPSSRCSRSPRRMTC